MVDYQPVALVPECQTKVNEFYKGVQAEIVQEAKGFILKMYVDGKHIGGLQQLPDAMKVNG